LFLATAAAPDKAPSSWRPGRPCYKIPAATPPPPKPTGPAGRLRRAVVRALAGRAARQCRPSRRGAGFWPCRPVGRRLQPLTN